MHILLLLLTPVLLLAIVALLGFVGCDRVYGLHSIDPPKPGPVQHVQTTVKAGAPNTAKITADPLTLQGNELIIATVQWQAAAVQPPAPVVTGADFVAVPGGGPYPWNGFEVQSFWGNNPDGNTSVTVEVFLAGGSSSPWNLCVSAYRSAEAATPPYSPQQSGPISTGPTTAAPEINLGDGDMLYAVGFAADSNGAFPGNNSLTAGPGLTAEFTSITNPLVEDGGSGKISAQVTNTGSDPNARGFIVAMGITAKSTS